jgi:hypothetical protein
MALVENPTTKGKQTLAVTSGETSLLNSNAVITRNKLAALSRLSSIWIKEDQIRKNN